MASKSLQLHIVFLPQLAHGHLIPTVDMARLFARHGVKVTIATTPLNAHLFAKTIQRDSESGFEIGTYIIKFPSAEVGLPEGCENVSSLTSQEMQNKFFKAVNLFQQPLEQLLEELRPDCLVAGLMFSWATDVASKFGIPRLVFHGTSCFSISIVDSVIRHAPYKKIATDFEFFDVPGLPDQIKMTKMQLPDFMKEEGGSERRKMMNEALESERISFGVIVNSFYELEPAYREHYSKVMGKKAWQVGPVSLCNKDSEDKAERGNVASIDRHECLRWLASKKPNSVLYICFGSLSRFSAAQLNEMAKVCTGAKEWSRWADDTKIIVTGEDIQRAVTQLMVGEEGEKMRNRTRELKDMARRAVEEGGSSYSDLNALLDELRLNCLPK
ncbi:hypothetical protein QQP08_007128 [Theobroma cacao]|nr:hypothetical protein QQP08_007128 [Theobroma cacao]